MKLPMRFRMLHLLSKHETLSEITMQEALRPEYGTEGQFKESSIDNHLQSMLAVGLIEIQKVSVDANGKLTHEYKITDYGTGRLNYLPKEWQ
ncbi:hypothetical protein [Desulfosporosinus sp.]|uniref:hypothetical protein n=1 Tax=Desulfosporosinus sp. TaxID=157907 RepID=UPI000E876C80|nr:hypothetical protein [Desulfosporosinus sp.]MBC2721649.1 DNA-binding protein [Desulfosporosinus sp.]MBC2728924.1 DNA-binding protein [Desulfosporosinus sp.]HBV85443.1 DNA-binding protein [Desulfosporosinus sp.]